VTAPVAFGTLENVSVRSAWAHEARSFTPWLAQNMDTLSTAIGIPLELTGTEVAVESFSADILARNPEDGSIVLIENQLEVGDHTHLGQIMTYLAGLNAHVVIWVAPEFRDPHLSAIRWLNEHTVEPYAFFAVRVRVVRIGDSPYAPLFDVLERPNDWDRSLQEVSREARAPTELGALRREFWSRLLERHPEEAEHGRATAASSRWRKIGPDGMVVGQYVAEDAVGVFIRGGRGVPPETILARLEPVKTALQAKLSAPIAIGPYGFIAEKKIPADARERSAWDRLVDWLHAEADNYEAALRETLGLGGNGA
jgi:hypothetical protein